MPNSLSDLQKKIDQHFNAAGVKDICFELNIDPENVAGETKIDKIRELILRLQRRERLPELFPILKRHRPTINWVSFSDDAPAASRPAHHITHPRNQLFTGREAWLAQLHDQLGSGSAVAVTQAVTGIGGVGKTQLALAYCYRHLDDYDLIQWLRADDATTLDSELAELAYRLGLADRSQTNYAALRQQVLTHLHQTPQRWLLVYDNADDITPAELAPYLPQRGNGASLITTRNPNWGGLAHALPLNLFSEAEAVTFLLGDGEHPDPDRAAAAALAQTLGHLPLALEHARAYVAATGCSLAEYDRYVAEEGAALWREDAEPPLGYDQRTIMTTWELAFAQAQQTAGAAALLNLCCFFAPDDIPLTQLLAAVAEMTDPPAELQTLAASPRQRDKAIAALRRFSLLERQGETVTLHRLVQTVARDRLPADRHAQWLTSAVALMAHTWPFKEHDLTTWPASADLLPHLRALLDITTAAQQESDAVARLNNQMVFYALHMGNARSALAYGQRALSISEKIHSSDHPTVAIRLSNLGALLKALGDLNGARPYMERALAIDEKALGPNHPSVATDLNNLGTLLQTMGDLNGARPYMERALAIDEKALGSDHSSVAIDLNNLGQLLQDMGDLDGARPYLERALTIDEKALGSEHPNVAINLNNLGQLLQDMGDLNGARPFLERALAISEKALGPDHPSVARDLNNLGQLLQAMGDLDGARPYLERALAISEKALGSDHPQVAGGNNNLGGLLYELGNLDDARPFLERALAISEKALGQDHPQVAGGNNNLGRLMQDLGDLDGAKPLLERALTIFEARLGGAHPTTKIVRENLASLLAEIEGEG